MKHTRNALTVMPAISLMFAGSSMADHLPGTLNFQNVTGDRINQVVAESGTNEKEVEAGDIDNDGDLDVVIAVAFADFGSKLNKMYRNDDGVFNEISSSGAIPGFTQADVSRNAFLRDFDGDGWLDIIIINDNNTGGQAGRSKLYMNSPVAGKFDSFVEVGATQLSASGTGAACSGVSQDFDKDGDFDLYAANYPFTSQDRLYVNNGSAGFVNMTSTLVPGDGDYTVDAATGDMNGDGNLDLLISNDFDPNFIYYNNNLDAGTGAGDFSYTGSTQNLGVASTGENSMEAADFDADGDLDIYWSNRAPGGSDRILQNNGNDGANKAMLAELSASTLPGSVTSSVSRKITVADLNDDGRIDAVVMKTTTRPTILRNTSVNGEISFVDWTPASAFPTGSSHDGWHAAVFDTDGDDDLDVFVGGFNNDHLFEQVASAEHAEGDLVGGVIPDVFNGEAAAVEGSGAKDEQDTFVVEDIASGALMSVVLNGPDDYQLEILDGSGSVLNTVDRGGLGVEEAIQVSASGTRQIRVTILESSGVDNGPVPADINGDGIVGPADLAQLLGAWGRNPGHAADLNDDGSVGPADLAILLGSWGPVLSPNYVLEVLSRSS